VVPITNYWHNFLWQVEQWPKTLKRMYLWLPVVWKDHDWDFLFLLKIIRFKLVLMEKVLHNSTIQSDGKKYAKQIRIAICHLDHYSDIYEYRDSPCVEPFFIKKGRLMDNNPFVKHHYFETDRLEQWHWEQFWSLLSKNMQRWWD